MDAHQHALRIAHQHADAWFRSLEDRDIPATATPAQLIGALGPVLPAGPSDPADVIDLLATAGAPGLVASPSGRFFGMVIGGTHPAALAADWLVSAWDQNAGLQVLGPTAAAAEELAGRWLLDLLGLPGDSAIGFPTGATMSNWSCLAAARDEVLRRTGWDVAEHGLTGAPPVHVLVGDEVHESVLFALSYLGLGRPVRVAADGEGRIDPVALAASLAALPAGAASIVVLQAGNVHSGAFDPFPEAVGAAHAAGAWVHVDGAFGLLAAASPRLAHLTAGMADADSWTTDAHKTLNVPYDCGITIVRDAAALNRALGKHGAYLIRSGTGDPTDRTPEFSRRARGVPVWAVLRSLGRQGVADLVEHLHDVATSFAAGLAGPAGPPGAEVLNDVVYTQVCFALASDRRTEDAGRRLMADGTAWISGSRWQRRSVLRVSASNWSTTAQDVQRALDALRRAVDDVDAAAVGECAAPALG